jgi:hypothetical protein
LKFTFSCCLELRHSQICKRFVSVGSSNNGKLGLFTQFLQISGVGGEGSVNASSEKEDIYAFDTVKTDHFEPEDDYVNLTAQARNFQKFMKANWYGSRNPVYMVTGIKTCVVFGSGTMNSYNSRSKPAADQLQKHLCQLAAFKCAIDVIGSCPTRSNHLAADTSHRGAPRLPPISIRRRSALQSSRRGRVAGVKHCHIPRPSPMDPSTANILHVPSQSAIAGLFPDDSQPSCFAPCPGSGLGGRHNARYVGSWIRADGTVPD